MPVSRIATVAVPDGATVPNAWSQPIFGSDHWSAYCASDGAASAARLVSKSTRVTDGSARSASSAARYEAAGSSIACIRSWGIASTSVAPADARTAAWSAAETPLANVTMNGTGGSTGAGVGVGSGAAVGAAVGSAVGAAVGSTIGAGVGSGVGTAVGSGVGAGVAVGSGVGVAVGSGVGVAAGSGVGVAAGSGVGVAAGSGVGVAAGSGVGVAAGSGVGVGLGLGVAEGSTVGAGDADGSAEGSTAAAGIGANSETTMRVAWIAARIRRRWCDTRNDDMTTPPLGDTGAHVTSGMGLRHRGDERTKNR